MKNKTRIGLKRVGIPEGEIDRVLRVLEGCVCPEDELEYLISSRFPSSDYSLAISLLVDRLFGLIRARKLCRWDFDLGDVGHRSQSKTQIDSEWSPPEHWTRASKMRVVWDIIGCFRQHCYQLVGNLLRDIQEATDGRQVKEIKERAIEQGVLRSADGRLGHCHSIPGAKRVFEAYYQATKRVD